MSKRDQAAAARDDELYWDLLEPQLATGQLEEGTIMSSDCVRANGEFVAMPEYVSGDLVVKLPAPRVAQLIDDNLGLPFAPAKRVFKEWVQVPGRDAELWATLLDEGIEFARASAKRKKK